MKSDYVDIQLVQNAQNLHEKKTHKHKRVVKHLKSMKTIARGSVVRVSNTVPVLTVISIQMAHNP